MDATTKTSTPTSLNTEKINFQRLNQRQVNLTGENRYFIGKPPELDELLGLMSEILSKGISVEKFQERFINFIHKNLPKEEDVVVLVLDIQDTLNGFKGKKSDRSQR